MFINLNVTIVHCTSIMMKLFVILFYFINKRQTAFYIGIDKNNKVYIISYNSKVIQGLGNKSDRKNIF